MTPREFWSPSGRFLIKSFGNGWAYAVTDEEEGCEFFAQDHSADQLQAESENFTNEDVLRAYSEALGEPM